MDAFSRAGSAADVAVVIPAHNEAERIAATVAAARNLPGVRQVLVVDDGSTDDTAARAEAAGAEVIRLPRNLGKGGAVRLGLRGVCAPGVGKASPRYVGVEGAPQASPGDTVLLLDADLGASAAEASKLLSPVLRGEAEMSIAVFPKTLHRGGFGLAVGLARMVIRMLAWRRMAAPLSGQRAIRRSLLDKIALARGFGLEVALTLDALAMGARLVEVPVEMTHAATSRSLAGFRHRGKQFLSVLAVAAPRLFWPLGPTGRPAGRARMAAWAAAVLALVLLADTFAVETGLPMALLALAWAWCAVIGAVMIADRLGWERENYQGRNVLSSVGICFPIAAIPFLALSILNRPNLHPQELVPVALALVMGAVGLFDDLAGSRQARGFAGHLRAAARGRVTSGLVKAVVGGGACLATGLFLAEWRLWPGLLDGVLVALCANATNLLDLRPGRALKGFWVLCALALLFGADRALAAAGLVLIASLIYAPLDFGARAMMGDAGSNVLGAVAGLALVTALPVSGRIALGVVLVALHVYAEFGSLSSLVERNRALRWLDALGRGQERAAAPQ